MRLCVYVRVYACVHVFVCWVFLYVKVYVVTYLVVYVRACVRVSMCMDVEINSYSYVLVRTCMRMRMHAHPADDEHVVLLGPKLLLHLFLRHEPARASQQGAGIWRGIEGGGGRERGNLDGGMG